MRQNLDPARSIKALIIDHLRLTFWFIAYKLRGSTVLLNRVNLLDIKARVLCRQGLLEYFWIIKGFDFFVSFPLLRHLPDFKQRIAGQSLPFEDFAIHKANKYFEQNGRLFLPGVVSDYIRLALTEHSQDTLGTFKGTAVQNGKKHSNNAEKTNETTLLEQPCTA